MTQVRIRNPLVRGGTSQRQREPLRITEQGAAPIDGRSSLESFAYLRRLSTLVRFYNEGNETDGDWSRFFDLDVSGIVAATARFDVAQFETQFRSTLQAHIAGTTGSQEKMRDLLLDAASTLEQWRQATPCGLKLRTLLDRWVHSSLGEALQAVYACCGDGGNREQFEQWAVANRDDTGARDRAPTFDADRISRAFLRFQQAFRELRWRAPEHFDDTLNNYSEHSPPMALILAVLQLFDYPRVVLNQLTLKHLDFYLEEVLGLRRGVASPDRVHVLFQLAKGASFVRVAQGTLLAAGNDATGRPLYYATESELVANQAHIDPNHGCKTIFLDTDGSRIRNVHAAPIANSADGLGANWSGEGGTWSPFGSAEMPYARLGFAIASPILFMAQGIRTIGLTFHLKAPVAASALELRYNVRVEVTGVKGWVDVEVTDVTVPTVVGTNATVIFKLRVGPDAPRVTAYSSKIHGEVFETDWPVLRCVLKNQGLPERILAKGIFEIAEFVRGVGGYGVGTVVRYGGKLYEAQSAIAQTKGIPPEDPRWNVVEYCCPYDTFAAMHISSVDIDALVEEFHDFVLENETGLLKTAKPFTPFGSLPHVGSTLVFGCPEIFGKRLNSLSITMNWLGIPANLVSHYAGYDASRVPSSNLAFTVSFQYLHDGGWSDLGCSWLDEDGETWRKSSATSHSIPLFARIDSAGASKSLFVLEGWNAVQRSTPVIGGATRYTPTVREGLLKVTLKKDFLHDAYPKAMASWTKSVMTASISAALGASRGIQLDAKASELESAARAEPMVAQVDTASRARSEPPNPPYTPTLAGVVLSYSACETISEDARREDIERRSVRLYQLGPFGHQEFVLASTRDLPAGVMASDLLVPTFLAFKQSDEAEIPAQGTLLIGIRGLKPPTSLSLLIQVAEGSEDPKVEGPNQIGWSYLSADGWVDFLPTQLNHDSTRRLSASGIVAFAVPKQATDASHVLPAGLHWLRATVASGTKGLPQIIAIHTQSVSAVFADRNNDPSHLAQPLAAGSIKQLAPPDANIKSVSQPYASFGGSEAESANSFRVRCAERLRHKRRAVALFDYERLVLEHFSDVYKCRCINHASSASEYVPGSVRVVVIPKLHRLNAVDPLRPRFSLARRNAIREYLLGLCSEFVELEVANADFEEVKLHFKVRFHAGFDEGFYTRQLNTEIVRHLSPWAFEEGKEPDFGGQLHRSTLMRFIESLEYVDFVSEFVMDQVVDGQINPNVEIARATRASAVLVATLDHDIQRGPASCKDAIAQAAPIQTQLETAEPSLPVRGCYLGNIRSRELHDLTRVTGACQIAEIAPDHRELFSTVQEAVTQGYDRCAHCFGGEQSRR